MRRKWFVKTGNWYDGFGDGVIICLLPTIEIGILRKYPTGKSLRIGWLGFYILFGYSNLKTNENN